jgi:hypothetical protein
MSLAACTTPARGGTEPATSAAGSCVIAGGPQAPIEVRIYESDPYGAPAGRRLYIGPLNRREQHRITTPTGRIWYAFRWHDGDVWREGFEAPCRDGQTLELPLEPP